ADAARRADRSREHAGHGAGPRPAGHRRRAGVLPLPGWGGLMPALPIERIAVRVLESPLDDHVPMSFSRLRARRTFLVEVHAGGHVGIGERWVNYPDWAPAERLATTLDGVAPLILGQDAREPGPILDLLVAALEG